MYEAYKPNNSMEASALDTLYKLFITFALGAFILKEQTTFIILYVWKTDGI